MISISRHISNVLTKIALSTPRTGASNASFAAALHTSRVLNCNKPVEGEPIAEPAEGTAVEKSGELTAAELKRIRNDRTKVIPVETSIRYLKSEAYKATYGDQPVWDQYRRNHLGMFPPRKTRKTCIRKGVISTGNPCPICRDEYLVLDHRNIDLLLQFISPYTGEILSYSKTGVCQKKHLELLVAIERAWDYGYLTFNVPFREYDYSEYYGKVTGSGQKSKA